MRPSHFALTAVIAVSFSACGGPPPARDDASYTTDSTASDTVTDERSDTRPVDATADRAGRDATDRDAAETDSRATDSGPAPRTETRIVHWQNNTDWPEDTGSYFTPQNLYRRVMQYDAGPDLFALQECGRACACGTNNYDARTATCTNPPPPESLTMTLQRLVGEPFDYRVSSWATAVYWRRARFTESGMFQWNWNDADPTHATCPRPSDPAGVEQMNIAVRLRDNRGTPDDSSDDKFVVLASMHVGDAPSCTTTLLRYFDRTVRSMWNEPAYVFVSGDFNSQVDTTSSSPSARRAELTPNCWYKLFTNHYSAGTCGTDYGDYFDSVFSRHPGGAPYSDTREICSQYSFVNPGDYHSADDSRCDSARSFSRIDYTFLRGASATADSIVSSITDQGYFDANGNGDVDTGEKYAGHRAIRTVVRY
jgi:hypothetical protein